MSLYLEKHSQTDNFNLEQFSNKTDKREEPKNSTACAICTEDPTSLCLVDKLSDIAIENKEAGLIIATAIAASIIIYVVSKSVSEILIAWHKFQN